MKSLRNNQEDTDARACCALGYIVPGEQRRFSDLALHRGLRVGIHASHGLLHSPPAKRTYHVLSQPDISCATDTTRQRGWKELRKKLNYRTLTATRARAQCSLSQSKESRGVFSHYYFAVAMKSVSVPTRNSRPDLFCTNKACRFRAASSFTN